MVVPMQQKCAARSPLAEADPHTHTHLRAGHLRAQPEKGQTREMPWQEQHTLYSGLDLAPISPGQHFAPTGKKVTGSGVEGAVNQDLPYHAQEHARVAFCQEFWCVGGL